MVGKNIICIFRGLYYKAGFVVSEVTSRLKCFSYFITYRI